jgi:hypothetical protein
VAHDGVWAAGEHGCQPTAVGRETSVPHRIDTAVKSTQMGSPKPAINGIGAEPDLQQL